MSFEALIERTERSHERRLSRLEKGILRSILYFEIFDHPLTLSELREVAQHLADDESLQDALDELVEQGLILEMAGHYLHALPSDAIERKLDRKRRALRVMPKAERRARF